MKDDMSVSSSNFLFLYSEQLHKGIFQYTNKLWKNLPNPQTTFWRAPLYLSTVFVDIVGIDQARKGADEDDQKIISGSTGDCPCSHKWPLVACWMVWAKRKLENGEMWFSCKSQPQRCIFQHKDVFPDRRDVFSNSAHCHFPHQAGARSLLQTGLLPGKQEKGGKKWEGENYQKGGKSPIESTCFKQAR